MILQNTKKHEEESKKEIFNIDSALQVDCCFQEYKKLLQETTIFVERFWYLLQTFNFYMRELIELGNKIVDDYLKIKKIYDNILKEKPDHRELIMLSLQFNQKVMNFESEAIQMTMYLKNID